MGAVFQAMLRSILTRGAVFGALLMVGASFGLAQPITPETKKAVIDGITKTVNEVAFVPGVDFSKWQEFIEKRKEEIEKADTLPAFTGVVNQALRDFGFSHIRLQTPVQAQNRNRTTRTGIGVTAVKTDAGLEVRAVAEQGPGKTAGLEVGDVIITVDGAKADNPDQLNGEEGTKKALKIQKKAGGDPVDVTVEAKTFSVVRKETLTWVNDDTAVLRVFTFMAGYGRENIEALVNEANGKAKNLILDLRSNGGGAVNNLNHLLSLLLPDKTPYGTFVSRRVYTDYVAANPDKPTDVLSIAAWAPRKAATAKRPNVEPFKGKIAVLINRGSGSASEIAAAALKENASAVLVGQRTAGAVLASTYARLEAGFSLQYPVSDYITIKGMRLERNPLVPDQEVTAAPAAGEADPVVAKAVEALKSAG